MNRLALVAFLLPLALAACAIDPTPPEESQAAALEPTKPAQPPTMTDRVAFCLPGETRVCTLGPPPVCHCELSKPPVIKQ